MKVLAIMPDVEGIQEVLDDIKRLLGCEELVLRSNFMQAQKSVKEYDVIIVHQNVSSVPLTAEDFEALLDSSGDGLVIPLLNETPGSEMMKRLFSVGIYNAIYQEESSADFIVKIIQTNRKRNDAKEYYAITSSDVKMVSEHILSEVQVKRIVEFLRSSSDVEGGFKYNIENLSTPQKLYLIQQLPEDLKEDLKESEIYITYERMLSGSSDSNKPIVLEQTITKEKLIEKTHVIQTHNKRRQLFTIFGNSELCAELAYSTAKNMTEEVLIIDLETIVPDVHLYLGMNETTNDGIAVGSLVTESSFLQAYEVAASKNLNYDILRNIAVPYKFKNLFVLTGNDNINKHESFNFEPLRRIIDISLDIFGAVFVNTPDDLYNSLSLYMLLNPKASIIIPFDGSSIGLRNQMKKIELLKKAQNVSMNNIRYLAFEYHTNVSMSESDIKQITQGLYVGKVSFDMDRIKARNDFKVGYVNKLPPKIESEYMKILNKYGIETKENISVRLKRFLKRSK
ncbi:MAG: hypothetical protein IBX70_12355 [Clostridia bacterium]|nr:hypothetical protein [Clostridia bacterium]